MKCVSKSQVLEVCESEIVCEMRNPNKVECERRKQLYWKIYQSVSVYFMKVNEERRLERATLRMLVRKLILKMQAGL